jgi:hypothetical protein
MNRRSKACQRDGRQRNQRLKRIFLSFVGRAPSRLIGLGDFATRGSTLGRTLR